MNRKGLHQLVRIFLFMPENVQMFKCSNVQMFKCSNVQMFKCSNVQMFMVALPCLRFQKYTIKPLSSAYPKEPQTLGDHIKKRRWDLKLDQIDVARNLSVSMETISNWENNNSDPHIKHYPAIVKFLEYSPKIFDESTLAGRIIAYRWRNGLSSIRMGSILGVHTTTVAAWENESSIPQNKQLLQLEKLLGSDDKKEGTH